MIWIDILLFALLPTIIIELAVLRFLRERRKKVLLGSVVMNILTNIPLNILAYYILQDLLLLLMFGGGYHLGGTRLCNSDTSMEAGLHL